MSAEGIKIFGGKASIKQNKFGVWQFRMWISAEKRYVEKSLRTKRKAEAIEKAEAMYDTTIVELAKGKTLFTPKVREAVARYLTERQRDVNVGNIVEGRWRTIRTQLKHFIAFVGEDTKYSSLEKNTLIKWEIDGEETSYLEWRVSQGVSKQTVRNELASINACQRHLYENEGIASHPRFTPPLIKLKRSEEGLSGEQIRRQTFTHEEWKQFYTALRSYKSKVKNRLSDEEYVERELVRHWCLFCANSGLRSGEQRQLTWNDITIEKDENLTLARVVVREETSKVGKERVFYTQGGEYLQRWKAIQKEYGVNTKGVLFSLDGETEYMRYRLSKHWKAVMSLADIDKERKARLVPYSLRHLAITNYVLSGNTLSDVAFTCGTSIKQIESTYYHLREEKMKSVATARFVRKNGKIFPIAKKIVG
jgi:integrase